MPTPSSKRIIWRFFDGKPGHDRQSAGFVRALAQLRSVETYNFAAAEHRVTALQFATRKFSLEPGMPAPHFIIGAGRRCQWPMLAARRARGGRTIYFMRPQMPLACFDLCVIPRHDHVPARANVLTSDGVLNDIEPGSATGDDGLILIGGPSAHFDWDAPGLVEQVGGVINAAPQKSWVVTNSRRTPCATSAALARLSAPNVRFVRAADTTREWLGHQFARSDVVWVSSDSVSMIFEALTAGAAVGLLEVPSRGVDRITTIGSDLIARGLVTAYAAWQPGGVLARPTALAEAHRCAELVLQRWR